MNKLRCYAGRYLSSMCRDHGPVASRIHKIFPQLDSSAVSTTFKGMSYSKTSANTTVSKKSRQVLKYLLGSVGSILLVGTSYIGFQWMKLRKKGIEMVWPVHNPRRPFYARYKGVVLTIDMVLRFDTLENFKVREDDIFLVTHPRSGTTWLQEIIFLITTNIDIDAANKKIMDDRFPFLDMFYPGIQAIDKMQSPRLIKTHLPFKLLPKEITTKKPKIIYCCRNPKDVLVSQYHMLHLFCFSCSFEKCFDDWINARLVYAPWWDHVTEFWRHRDDPNILVLKYEDLKQNTEAVIKKVGEFLGKPLTDEEIKSIKDHCHIDNMRANKTSNFDWYDKVNKDYGIKFDRNAPGWIRKGQIGNWQEQLTDEMDKKIDDIVSEKLKGTGLEFQEVESKT